MLNKLRFTALLCLVGLIVAAAIEADAKERPNIVLILADDKYHDSSRCVAKEMEKRGQDRCSIAFANHRQSLRIQLNSSRLTTLRYSRAC
ncbi:MAG: hypothetical protein H6823_18660 [Planctomycetaceae bacterium]|nr:hypothetical protein [Planctomycetaceae bacterium]